MWLLLNSWGEWVSFYSNDEHEGVVLPQDVVLVEDTGST